VTSGADHRKTSGDSGDGRPNNGYDSDMERVMNMLTLSAVRALSLSFPDRSD
jgi:hypothetical protein